jgi:hypothetical protein
MEELFDYIILTEDNTWEGTGKQCTQADLDNDIDETRERLSSNDRYDGYIVELVIVKGKNLEFISV